MQLIICPVCAKGTTTVNVMRLGGLDSIFIYRHALVAEGVQHGKDCLVSPFTGRSLR